MLFKTIYIFNFFLFILIKREVHANYPQHLLLLLYILDINIIELLPKK